jgi:hypothetical protein
MKTQTRPLAVPSNNAINHFMSVTTPAHVIKRIKPIFARDRFVSLRLVLGFCRLPPIIDALLAHRLADGLKIVDDRRHGVGPPPLDVPNNII